MWHAVEEVVNVVGRKFKYSCEDDYYMAGLQSDYNATASDRVWRVECCRTLGQLQHHILF